MRLSRWHAGSQRQDRLRTIQRLHLTFLVYAEHHGPLGWIHVQPDDIPHLLHELRVFRELEVFDSVRLQSKAMPDPHHSALRKPRGLRHQARTPMSYRQKTRNKLIRRGIMAIPDERD
jgi:hypothetical protein